MQKGLDGRAHPNNVPAGAGGGGEICMYISVYIYIYIYTRIHTVYSLSSFENSIVGSSRLAIFIHSVKVQGFPAGL